jgi:aminoglycoside phosphotransferase
MFNSPFLQFIGSVFFVVMLFAFWGLYATFTCTACSQLEKLRANLLDIRQKHYKADQDSGDETDQEEEQQVQTSEELFPHMQKQLNDCIRHHQQIIR